MKALFAEQRQWRARAESPCVACVRTAAAAAEGSLPTNSASLEGSPAGLLWAARPVPNAKAEGRFGSTAAIGMRERFYGDPGIGQSKKYRP